jgi:hypothetical protein
MAKPKISKKQANSTVVHLGNIGNAENIKTQNYAQRFKKVKFIGIDLKKHKSTEKNWIQKKYDFLKGLKKMKNSSVKIISSEFALGFYEKNASLNSFTGKELIDYSNQVIKTAYQKLQPGGKLMFIVIPRTITIMRKMFKETGFLEKNITTKLMINPTARTEYFKKSGNNYIFQIVAIK